MENLLQRPGILLAARRDIGNIHRIHFSAAFDFDEAALSSDLQNLESPELENRRQGLAFQPLAQHISKPGMLQVTELLQRQHLLIPGIRPFKHRQKLFHIFGFALRLFLHMYKKQFILRQIRLLALRQRRLMQFRNHRLHPFQKRLPLLPGPQIRVIAA
ncbi:hypothetical protein D3C81_1480080 [compost metagenome]